MAGLALVETIRSCQSALGRRTAADLRHPFGYWQRRKVAVGLLSLLHLPVILGVALTAPILSFLLGAAFCGWMLAIVHSRLLRGWAVRLPAEAVADLLRVGVPTSAVLVVSLYFLDLPIFWPLILQAATFFALTAQALFWRGKSGTWVRILGSPSNLGAAVGTFEQCMDLLGRDGCRFAPFRADKPEPEAWERRITAWLSRGETVLVLEPQLRHVALRTRPLGDVIFAHDCVLFTPIARPAGPVVDFVLGVLNQLCAVIAALMLWPLALVIAMLIRLDDDGPVFFTQERIGRDGQTFVLYKFRTMRIDSSPYAIHPNGDDPRITRPGRWLRKFSLDELPQILNVLRGDMRLVGPRPEMPFIVEHYDEQQWKRLAVTPGITGLWQVSPHRNEPIHEHLEYDLAYIAHRGPILDLALIVATAGLANSTGN